MVLARSAYAAEETPAMKLNTPRWWYRRQPDHARVTRTLLRPLGWIWAGVTARRIARATPVDPGCPVISVGNLTVGGSGKTPVAREILRLGLTAGISPVISNGCVLVFASLAARFGTEVLAGYGIGVRMEFMLVPLAFGIGSALTTIVGVAAGAGDWKRAVHAAWYGSLISGGAIGVLGWIVALVPEGWARLFTGETPVVSATVGYITHVAPFYVLFGIGMTLSFASQGAGRMKAPFFAGICRLAVATGGGWYAVTHLQWGLSGVFIAIAAGMITFGAIISLPLLVKPWGPKRAKLPKTGGSDEPALDVGWSTSCEVDEQGEALAGVEALRCRALCESRRQHQPEQPEGEQLCVWPRAGAMYHAASPHIDHHQLGMI